MMSPLARPFPAMPPVAGVTVSTARAGYKPWDRDDLTFVRLAPGTAVAGVLTRSRCPSPEVELCRAHLATGRPARALVVNAGNSNAFTGAAGAAALAAQVARAAALAGCDPHEIYAASTGVIGVPLPADRAMAGVEAAFAAAPADWRAMADAIGTTDTFPKAVHRDVLIAGGRATIVGVVKGSGMIAPDMATMLGFLFTDAAVAPGFLQACLDAATPATFGAITVDGDTSTSDTVLLFATGTAGTPRLDHRDSFGADAFAAAVHDVCRELAELVVRDGEGARKLIRVTVTGALSDADARAVAFSIANSPLVKTAIAGGDANWGRVVMAVGKAGVPADRDRLRISFGGTAVAADGAAVPGYDEAPVARHLAGDEIAIAVDLGLGDARFEALTCDLTDGYIRINADYRS